MFEFELITNNYQLKYSNDIDVSLLYFILLLPIWLLEKLASRVMIIIKHQHQPACNYIDMTFKMCFQ